MWGSRGEELLGPARRAAWEADFHARWGVYIPVRLTDPTEIPEGPPRVFPTLRPLETAMIGGMTRSVLVLVGAELQRSEDRSHAERPVGRGR